MTTAHSGSTTAEERARVERVLTAMGRTPRHDYLTPEQTRHADEDRALPLFEGQTNSQPSTVAEMLYLLDVPAGARVLDIGAGSGWTTAILADLVTSTGSVLGLELVPSLAAWGAENLARAERPWARLELAEPGVLGRPEEGPYDRILVSAMAADLPPALLEQLAQDGILVIPVGGRMLRVTRDPEGRPHVEAFGAYRFVPLL